MINLMATLDTGSTQLLQRGHPAHRGSQNQINDFTYPLDILYCCLTRKLNSYSSSLLCAQPKMRNILLKVMDFMF